MAVRYDTQETGFRFRGRREMTARIRRCVASEGFRAGDIAVVFCSDAFLLAMNREYLGHDYYTDVITFDYSDLPARMVSGDLFISVDTVADNALQFGVARDEELRRVILHGVLHLCGYGDKTDAEQRVMRSKEDFYLRQPLLNNQP